MTEINSKLLKIINNIRKDENTIVNPTPLSEFARDINMNILEGYIIEAKDFEDQINDFDKTERIIFLSYAIAKLNNFDNARLNNILEAAKIIELNNAIMNPTLLLKIDNEEKTIILKYLKDVLILEDIASTDNKEQENLLSMPKSKLIIKPAIELKEQYNILNKNRIR